jgi:hypothetical protein
MDLEWWFFLKYGNLDSSAGIKSSLVLFTGIGALFYFNDFTCLEHFEAVSTRSQEYHITWI